MNDTIEHNGLTFRVTTEHDDSMRAPWREHDGHIEVREVRATEWGRGYMPGKRAGDVVLHWGRWTAYVYNLPDALKRAREESWGLSDEARAALTKRLGREPSAREVTAEAVRLDAERMRAWINDEWSWVGVVVTLLDVEGAETHEHESMWGIESDSPDYHEEVARELAEQIAERQPFTTMTRTTRARSETIFIR